MDQLVRPLTGFGGHRKTLADKLPSPRTGSLSHTTSIGMGNSLLLAVACVSVDSLSADGLMEPEIMKKYRGDCGLCFEPRLCSLLFKRHDFVEPTRFVRNNPVNAKMKVQAIHSVDRSELKASSGLVWYSEQDRA